MQTIGAAVGHKVPAMSILPSNALGRKIHVFVAGQAHAVATGRGAPAKRNAEIMAVEQVTRWRSEVSRFRTFDRLDEFDRLIADALNNPAPVQRAG